MTQHQFIGPLPPPIFLKGYEDVVKGSADRILTMAEEDAAHYRAMELKSIDMMKDVTKRGQRFGLAMGCFSLIACIAALYFGSESTAKAIGQTTVIGLVTVFVTGKFIKKQ